MTRAKAEPVTHIDDDRFRVTEWRFAAGAETGWHIHGHDYVIVPLTDGTLGLEGPDGAQSQATLTQGVPYSRRTGVAHNVINAGEAPLSFLEVEVVEGGDRTARRLAVLDRFLAAWNARDVDELMQCMAEDCAFHGSAGPEAEGRRHFGREAVRAAYAALFEAFPQAAWTKGRHVVTGDTGLSSWRFVGTSKAGQTVDVDGCDIFTFSGDLIALKDSYRKSRG
ncbi:nuclear transport factor 2 family protein [Oryzicola mucosus]|uniref:Nuclear transport factor 2 family protein n=1 Tax=Oryzicola mucosus TaxID=2767425 RepID=A0A8J6U220_9HYPH|nr:nuclear transport factor 2 family protein [Oryzicola mucosus]MBD0415273.1 nuclear transport factor 2 family protein [Oryzicola mucosus]